MKLSRIIALLLITPLFALSAQAKGPEKEFPAVPGEYLVKLKSEPNSKSLNTFEDIARRLRAELKKSGGISSSIEVRVLPTSNQYAVIVAKNIKSARAILSADDRVAYAEPNYLYYASDLKAGGSAATLNDAQFGQLWGLENLGQKDPRGQTGKANADIRVVPIWNEGITGNKNVKVAIIDTGVDFNHPDLQANILKNAGEIAGDGIDNDKNGFIDDVYGWDFANNRANGLDDQDHGTHCAGTIGGVGNNGIGVAGVNWNVSILPVKFLDANGSGSLANAVSAIQYATKAGVRVMSNSWGGGPATQALYDVIKDAQDRGILFVAAAGNNSSDNDAKASYPASYALDNVLSVAATDNRDTLASFSNYGATSVHVAAPGVNIFSTVKGGTYGVMSGTSMATPHVSGVAALMLSVNPSLSYAQIKDTLIRSSDKVRGLSKKVVAGGRVNVYNAIHGIFPVAQIPAENLWKDYAYTVESPHPYLENKTYSFSFDIPKAKFVRVVFDFVKTETRYDTISIRDGKGEEVESISGTYAPGYIAEYVDGGKGTITLNTDDSTNGEGFRVQKLQVIY